MENHLQDVVDVFIDLRSPYSYLALQPARMLSQHCGVRFEWWPFITDFRSAYGGEAAERSERDVSKLKYLYMDCRRLAERQGLTIRSTTKLWDARLASKAFLFARSKDRLWEFCDPLLAAFWRREFDLESPERIEEALEKAGLSTADWRTYLQMHASSAMGAAVQKAESHGVFGAPTFVHRGELFWGGDRMDLLAAAISAESFRSEISIEREATAMHAGDHEK